MIKIIPVFTKTASGLYVQPIFDPDGGLLKTAGAPIHASWSTGEEIEKFLQTLTSEDRKNNLYALVNALGAGEYYGSNINADFFPWNALVHEGKDYGYQTFLDAHIYQHHINKQPEHSIGKPVRSILNHEMKRVELILEINRAKADIEKAGGIVKRIEDGDFVDVSMGAKVPFDICMNCGHKSKTRADYCTCMNPPEDQRRVLGPNKILPNGKRICVTNTLPKFFDISFVYVGADKTAKVMAKLAEKDSSLCLGDVCTIPKNKIASLKPIQTTKKINLEAKKKDANLWSMNNDSFTNEKAPYHADPDMVSKDSTSWSEKGASVDCTCGCEDCEETLSLAFKVKTAAHSKLSEIIKTIPTDYFALHTLPKMESKEPSIPTNILNELGSSYPVGSSCNLLGSLGIVLKPQEFQRIVLVRMGEKEKADKMDAENSIFSPSKDFGTLDQPKSLEGLDKVFEMVKNLIANRTAFGKPFVLRIMMSESEPNFSLPTHKTVEDPVLTKIGAAYNTYRRNLLMKLSQVKVQIEDDPRFRAAIFGETVADMFNKSANSSYLTRDSMSYLLGAYMSDRSLLCNTATAEAMAAHNPSLFELFE